MMHLARKGIPINKKTGIITEKTQSRDQATGAGDPGEPTMTALHKGIDM
jgi:hypothetical protein